MFLGFWDSPEPLPFLASTIVVSKFQEVVEPPGVVAIWLNTNVVVAPSNWLLRIWPSKCSPYGALSLWSSKVPIITSLFPKRSCPFSMVIVRPVSWSLSSSFVWNQACYQFRHVYEPPSIWILGKRYNLTTTFHRKFSPNSLFWKPDPSFSFRDECVDWVIR